MVLCSVLYVGLTTMFDQLFLRMDELLVISRNAPIQVFGLSVLSMEGFIRFGLEIVLGIGIPWFISAIIRSVAAAKMLIRIRLFPS